MPGVAIRLVEMVGSSTEPLIMLHIDPAGDQPTAVVVGYKGVDRDTMVSLFRVVATSIEDGIPFEASITCPKCQMTSYHPKDVELGYCGNCHDYTSRGKTIQP